jgi:LuxR family transcriptional regulator, maltose regulon positive regulatory protein
MDGERPSAVNRRQLTGRHGLALSFERMKTPADELPVHLERAAVALTEGRVDDLLLHARCAARLVDADDVATHMRVASLLQASFRFSGEPELFDQALAACVAVGNRTDQPQWAIPARALAGNVLMLAGRLFQAIEYCDAALALAEASGLQNDRVAAMGHQFRGYVLMEWNQLDQAQDALMTAWSLSTVRDHGVRSGVARMLAEVALARGDATTAVAWGETLAQIVSEPMTLRNREWLAAVRARQGFAVARDLRAIDAWQRRHDYRLDALEALSDRAVAARLHELEHLLTMLEATAQWTSLGRLAAVVERGARPLRAGYLVRALCARAIALEATGHGSTAMTHWLAALDAGAIGGYVRAYSDGTALRRRLLQRAADDPRGAPHAARVMSMGGLSPDATLVAELTERQRDVLRLVADGLSDREISIRLGLSVATIKTHLRAIFARLNARSRTAAVAKARVAGLLTVSETRQREV